MFRMFTKVSTTKLSRSKHGPSRLYKTVRFYSKKDELCPPPVPKPGTGSGIKYTIGTLALITGGVIGYAKYDPEFRKFLKENAPFTDDVIKVVCMEEQSYWDMLMSLFASASKPEPEKAMPGKKRAAKHIQEGSIDYKPPPPVFPKIADEVKTQSDYTEIRIERKVEGEEEPRREIGGDVKPDSPELTPVEIIANLEKKMAEEATNAIQAFNKSIYALKNYTSDVEIIIEESVDRVDPEIWNNLRQKAVEKEELIEMSKKQANEAIKTVNSLKTELNRNKDLPFSLKERTKLNLQKVQDDITEAKNELLKEVKRCDITDKYWNQVSKSRKFFSNELEALFPNVKLDEKKVKINDQELDLFIMHAMSRVLYYQKELHKLETMTEQRLTDAIEAAKKTGNCEALTAEQLCEKLDKEKRLLEQEFNNKCMKLRKESEAELRNKLKLQSEAFSDHLGDAVKTRELELERSMNRKFDEQLTEERCKYKMQVSAMIGRLRGMEEAMKVRADADRSAHQAQVLWSACQSLFKSIKAGCPGIPWMDQIRPLYPEILAVEKAAADNDELVKVVIDGIPSEARNRGVYPEDALRERFLKVEKVARSLALLPECGGRLHMYFFSYLQSLLLLNAANPISQAEINDEVVDFTKLSTNEILQRARYWLDRGDFSQTLKYMNLLKGAPRVVAKQWMNETRILLETQQAANTLMAYAAANGLKFL